jgi:hypothetical protein
MRKAFWLSVFLVSSFLMLSGAAGQTCTTYVVVPAIDHATHDHIENLKAENFEARMGRTPLQVVSATQDFNNRLLVLVEVDQADRDARVGEAVDMITRLARLAPEGKPLAFGIYADKAVFSTGFNTKSRDHVTDVNDVIERTDSLGKRVAMFDALHQGLALFGAHQPGDTVLLVADPYDDKSRHSTSDLKKEFFSTGTRLSVMLRQPLSDVGRDYLWNPHYREKDFFDTLTFATGGAYTDFEPYRFESPWKGYMLGIALPDSMRKPRGWHLKLRGSAVAHGKPRVYYPAMLLPCSTATTEKNRAPSEARRNLAAK